MLVSQSRATPLRILLPPSLCVTDTLSSMSRAVRTQSDWPCLRHRMQLRSPQHAMPGCIEAYPQQIRVAGANAPGRRAVELSSCAQDAHLTALAYQHRRSAGKRAAKRRESTHYQTTRAVRGPLRRRASIWASCGCGNLQAGHRLLVQILALDGAPPARLRTSAISMTAVPSNKPDTHLRIPGNAHAENCVRL